MADLERGLSTCKLSSIWSRNVLTFEPIFEPIYIHTVGYQYTCQYASI